MLHFGFNNYAEFRELFGMEEHGNGIKSRKNKILLNHLKSTALHKWCVDNGDFTLLQITSMAELKKAVLKYVMESGEKDLALDGKCMLMGYTLYSAKHETDEHLGVCEDLDTKSVRYINMESDRTFKMKAGKFMMALIKETIIGKALSESVVVWLGEEFTSDWGVYTGGLQPEFSLHVDDNFEKIYDPNYCKEFNGCSCMVGKNRHSFYEEAVKAKAAYIEDEDGLVIARAILFTDVTDENGKKWRLLERQYAKHSDETFKRILVDQLIKAGEIDGYKKVGAGCGDSRSFVDNFGNSLSHKVFTIDVDLETYDCLSYQDSFKFYDIGKRIAKNVQFSDFDYQLDTTEYSLDGDEEESEYDDFHDYSCDEVTTCYYHGREYSVDVNNLGEFRWVDSENDYYHEDDVVQCDECGLNVLKEKAVYSDLTEEYYCSEKCMQKAEEAYKRDNWYYSSMDDVYVEDEDELTTIQLYDGAFYREETILLTTLAKLCENGELVECEKENYYKKTEDYGYATLKEAV